MRYSQFLATPSSRAAKQAMDGCDNQRIARVCFGRFRPEAHKDEVC